MINNLVITIIFHQNLIALTTRVINNDKVEGMNSASYNTSCNGEMRWDGDGGGAGGEDDLMMISMMPVMMVIRMATISPCRRCSPRRNLPAGDGFSSL